MASTTIWSIFAFGNKTNAGMGSLYRSKHELIFVYSKGKGRHVIELEPRYVDATVKRWETLTGCRAEREAAASNSVLGESRCAGKPAQSMPEEGSGTLGDAVCRSDEESGHD